jgi:uridine kinase
VDAALALRRGIARDTAMEGAEEAARVHRDRYGAAEMIYMAEVDPLSLADLVIDNGDFADPRIVRERAR